MKKTSKLAVLAGLAIALAFLAACGGAPAALHGDGVSGTATGTAIGFNGEISVTITLTDGIITAVEMDLSIETPSFAAPVYARAPAEMIRFNSVNIDNVAGSTITVVAVREAAQNAIAAIIAAAAE
jgi:uncharacterized protein with FMN-binding domain